MIEKIEDLNYDHLLNRPWYPPQFDCYALAVDFFDPLGIKLTNYARPNDWWLDKDLDLYMEHYRDEGFELIDAKSLKDLRPLDVHLISLPDARNRDIIKTNHCAIYVGDGKILHHMIGKRSEVAEYREAFRHFTTATIRHKDIPDLRPKVQTQLDILDYVLPHKREWVMGVLNDKK